MMGFDIIVTTAQIFLVWVCIGWAFVLTSCWVIGREQVEEIIEDIQDDVGVTRSMVLWCALFVFSFGGGYLFLKWVLKQMLWPFVAFGGKDDDKTDD